MNTDSKKEFVIGVSTFIASSLYIICFRLKRNLEAWRIEFTERVDPSISNPKRGSSVLLIPSKKKYKKYVVERMIVPDRKKQIVKFPWEPVVDSFSNADAPLLCTFITPEAKEEISIGKKLKIIAGLQFSKQQLHVGCPCCQ